MEAAYENSIIYSIHQIYTAYSESGTPSHDIHVLYNLYPVHDINRPVYDTTGIHTDTPTVHIHTQAYTPHTET